MSKSTHGGKRPGAGRKPGVGTFAGGRHKETVKLRTGQVLTMRLETDEGNTPMSTVRVDVIDPKRIELIITDSNAGDQPGDKYILLS